MEEIKWSLQHFLAVDGDAVHRHYALDVQGYNVADYDHYPTEEEVLRDIHIFEKGQERGRDAAWTER